MLALLSTLLIARPLLMAHYMPWYVSKPFSGRWGWHWTMNHFDPEKRDAAGRQQLASRYRPLIGAYDSADPEVLQCQTQLMKLAGIDGVFIDWYGSSDLYDYSLLNLNSQKMIDACTKVGLKFSIVMEDQIVPNLINSGNYTSDAFAVSSFDYLESSWFKLPGYLKWNGKPVLLIFGPQYYKEPDLSRLFTRGEALFTLQNTAGPAVGAFGWPEPQSQNSWVKLKSYYERAKRWPANIPVVYPRFEDIYKEAGGSSYGEISDDNGATFQETLKLALESKAPFIQIATWNDWGEGTQIEPSVEFGYRDLTAVQTLRRKLDPKFPYKPADLRKPVEAYRSKHPGNR